MSKIFLDTETNGLAPGQICQLAFIEENDNLQIISAKNYFFTPEWFPEELTIKFGRDLEWYKKASNNTLIFDSLEEIADKLHGNTMVAHNAKFDAKFLEAEFVREGIDFEFEALTKDANSDIKCIDTMTEFKHKVRATQKNGNIKNPSLSDLCDWLQISPVKIADFAKQVFAVENSDWTFGAHDARYDTAAMYIAYSIDRAATLRNENMGNPAFEDYFNKMIEAFTVR